MQQTVFHLARRSAPQIGGVESHLSQLIPELQKLGYHSSILNEQMLLDHSGGIRSHKLAVWAGMFRQLPALWQAAIIHVHDVFWWLLPFLPLLWWKRIYITFHGYESVAGPSQTQKFWHQLASWLTRGTICIGGFHTKWYGVTSNQISYGAVARVQKQPHTTIKKAVFIGRLESDTGFGSYMQAVALAKKNGSKIHLDVYGEGSQRSWAEQYVRRHKLPVTFYGFVPNAGALIGRYSCAFVSQYLAILESLSAGVPVIAYAKTEFKKDYLQMTTR